MSERKMPDASLAAMSALGEAWRGDWSDCDGRLLRAQLDSLASLIRAEVKGEDIRGRLAAFYATTDLCPYCQSWNEHCICGDRPVAA